MLCFLWLHSLISENMFTKCHKWGDAADNGKSLRNNKVSSARL